MSDAVAAELDALVELNTEGPYLFSTTLGKKPIQSTNLSGAIAGVAKATCAGDNRYRPADIRRSVETRLQALGVSRDERAQLMSHGRTAGVQGKHYERYDYLPEKRAALALWERHLTSVLEAGSASVSSAASRPVGRCAGTRCRSRCAWLRPGKTRSRAMWLYAAPIAFTLFAWWSSTIGILYLVGLPRHTHKWRMAAGTVVLGVALYVLNATRAADSGAAYAAFSAALLVWGWQELAFLLGYLTGPARTAPPAGAASGSRCRSCCTTSWRSSCSALPSSC